MQAVQDDDACRMRRQRLRRMLGLPLKRAFSSTTEDMPQRMVFSNLLLMMVGIKD
ncbi:hypothetical protein [Parasutterella excrementihominis]|uniref:hypothetical protein n=1 Tax=Parasutterella excrementihominis TaxID=487175 RepID=UPI003AF423DB